MLVFNTVEDYMAVTDEVSDEFKNNFVAELNGLENFNSLSEKSENDMLKSEGGGLDTLIKSDYFKSLLNEDLAIQIQDYIFRINPLDEKVYVLDAKNFDEYSDLINENIENPDIKQFTTDQFVLSELYALPTDTLEYKGCNESGAPGKSSGDTKYWKNIEIVGGVSTVIQLLRFKPKVDYSKYGIYFELHSKMTCEEFDLDCSVFCWHNYDIDMWFDYTVEYKPKCESNVTRVNYRYDPSGISNKIEKTYYASMRPLSKYYLWSFFYCPTTGYNQGAYEINYGY